MRQTLWCHRLSKVWSSVLYYEQRIKNLCMSKVLKVVFVAFTQHCIQSNLTHISQRCQSVLCIQRSLTPNRGKAIWRAFCLVGLVVHYSDEVALLTFWDLSNYKGSCRQDAQPSPNYSKLRVLSSPVILIDLWKQRYIIHTVRLPAYIL